MGAIVRNVVNDQLLSLSYKDPKNIKRFLRNWGGLEGLSEKGGKHMENLIGVIVLVILTGGASAYLIRAKKKGVKCVGCPAGGSCCSCRKEQEETKFS